jgi:hypothetical protein
MGHLNPAKLHVTFAPGTTSEHLVLPRRYTLTHSDMTGELFLTVGDRFDKKQISGLYTRLMRDEVLAELSKEQNKLAFKVYCHVSGSLAFGPAGWRNDILHTEMPLVLEAVRYADRLLFEKDPGLDSVPVLVYFQSNKDRYNKVENWGTAGQYAQ